MSSKVRSPVTTVVRFVGVPIISAAGVNGKGEVMMARRVDLSDQHFLMVDFVNIWSGFSATITVKSAHTYLWSERVLASVLTSAVIRFLTNTASRLASCLPLSNVMRWEA